MPLFSFLRRRFFTALCLFVCVGPRVIHAQDNQIVYDDALENGWQDWSWGVSVNAAATAYVHSGTASYQVTVNQSGAGLQLHHLAFDTSPYASLTFWINGGATGGQKLQLYAVVDGVNQPAVSLSRYLTGGVVKAGVWLQATIPLADLGAANSPAVSALVWQDASGGAQPAYDVDDIVLAGITPHSLVHVTVNAAQSVRPVDDRVFGLNTAAWDSNLAPSGSAASIPLITAINPRILRFPGGSISDGYHWATNMNDGNTWTWATNFDDFAVIAQAANAQAFITVNYGSGTAQEAADWVTYSNVTHKYGFKYWEIGNECYGTWENDTHTVQHDPYTYALAAKDYITAMKAADPTIKVGVVVTTGEDSYANNTNHPVTNPRTGQVHNGWTPVLLATLKSLGVTPDFVIYHRYEQNPGDECDPDLLHYAETWPNDAANLRQQLDDYLGSAADNVEIDVTENNSVSSDTGKQTTSLVNGLYYADSVGNLLQTEINSLVWWDLYNGQETGYNNSPLLYGWRDYGDYGVLSSDNLPYPTYYVMKLLTHFARSGDTVVTATGDSPLLATYAVQRQDGTLTLLVINKSATATLNASFAINGFTPQSAATVYSYGIPQDNAAQSGSGSPDIAQSTLTNAGPTFTASFGPYSATVLSLSPASTAPTSPAPTPGPTGTNELVNLSTRANVGTGANILIAGFVIGGNTPKTVLIRGLGPALTNYGVPGVLAAPALNLYSGGTIIASNTGWSTAANAAQIAAAAQQVGAGALPAGSADSALLMTLQPGPYTVQVSGADGGSGIALAEVYDTTGSFTTSTPRLINISARAQVGTGAATVIPGFVIGGSTPKTVLIRAIGPGLAAFGVSGFLADPQIAVHTTVNGQDTVVASNDNWGGDPKLVSAFTATGAFPLPDATSKDAALLVTLQPGAYTALVTGVNGTTGIALVEVYEMP